MTDQQQFKMVDTRRRRYLAPKKQTTATVRMKPTINQNPGQNITLNDALEKLYADIESAPSFSAKINAYLRSNTVHSQHRRIVKKKFPRRRIISRFPFDIFMADLIEYPRLKFQNNGYVYILVLIDCFTRKIWVEPMKRKTSKWSADAFEAIFKNFDQFPIHIITDRGLGNVDHIYTLIHNNSFRIL